MTKDTWLDGDAASTSLDAAPQVDVVTGDAVTLDFRPVSAMSRGAAFFIDAVVYTAVFVGWTMLAEEWLMYSTQMTLVLSLIAIWSAYCVTPLLVETFSGGKSVGKWCLGTQVVRDDGGPIRWQHAMLRTLMGVVELWTNAGAVAFFVSISNAQGKRMGDMLAGTMVISSRGKPLVLWQPPEHVVLRSWAVAADVDRLPPMLEHQFRQLVTRQEVPATPGQRQAAAEVVQEAVAYMYPAPPVGADPFDVMVAVLEQRMNRDRGRALRQQQDAAQVMGRARKLPFAPRSLHSGNGSGKRGGDEAAAAMSAWDTPAGGDSSGVGGGRGEVGVELSGTPRAE